MSTIRTCRKVSRGFSQNAHTNTHFDKHGFIVWYGVFARAGSVHPDMYLEKKHTNALTRFILPHCFSKTYTSFFLKAVSNSNFGFISYSIVCT